MTLQHQNPTETLRERALPALETERLVLRAPRLADAEALATLINDRRIAENTATVPHPYTLADAEKFITSATEAADTASFLITARDGTLLGGCGVGSLRGDGSLRGGPPEIGYWIGVPFWGNGFATEAARAVIDHAFVALGHDAIRGGARVSNPASRRVMEKCGFQWTGVELIRIRAISSAAPIDRFRLDRGLWASLKSWGKVRQMA
jgi:RimJ/RimL family protein N-acetyltransferase